MAGHLWGSLVPLRCCKIRTLEGSSVECAQTVRDVGSPLKALTKNVQEAFLFGKCIGMFASFPVERGVLVYMCVYLYDMCI